MGCCASGERKINPNQQNPTQPQANGFNNVVSQVPAPPAIPPVDTKAVNVQNSLIEQQASKFSAGIHAQQPQRSQIKQIQQSIVQPLYGSDAIHQASALNGGENKHQYQNKSAINPIAFSHTTVMVPDHKSVIQPNAQGAPVFNTDAIKINSSKVSEVQKMSTVFNVPDHVPSQIQNMQEERLVELGNVKELLASHPRSHEKGHGEEQVLQTYHQNFEIPIFEVSLTAKS